MKKRISCTLFLAALTFSATAQVKVVRPYQPPAQPANTAQPVTPASYSSPSPAPVTYSAPATSDADARRAAALAKVQGRPANTATAKGLAPAQYSTDGLTPVAYDYAPDPATTVTVNGQQVQRNVRKGRGQVGSDLFTPVSELHYVQFAVYCKDTPVDKAPAIEGLYLLWHPGSTCPGGASGASYIVKGYTTADEARAAVLAYKAQKIDCWYNPALTGAEVEVIGVR